MRKNVILSLIAASLFAFSASIASAVDVDADIVAIFESAPGGSQLADLVIDADGNATTSLLATGNIIQIDVTVANPSGELFDGIFTTLVHQGDQVSFLGANPIAPSILAGGTFFNPTALNNVGSGAVKGNTPNPDDGSGGDVWVQAIAYGAGGGTDGTGPDNAISLFYRVTGASGSDFVDIPMEFTSGDGTSASVANLQGVTINVPEPGTALLMGLGLAGLAAAGRRRE